MEFRPLLLVLVCFFAVGLVLNLAVAPFVDTSSPVSGSALAGFSNFVENGWEVSIVVPIFGEISTTISPVTWFWFGISSITDFVVEQINLLTYLSDTLAIPLVLLFILAFSYAILSLIRGN